MTIVSPNSRIQIINTPILPPGVCSLCGIGGDSTRTFIDFGKQLDWYGAVYFCSECIIEVSNVMGFIPVAKFDEVYAELRKLRIEHDKLQRDYELVKNAIHSLSAGRVTYPVDDSDSGISSISSMEESESPSKSDKFADEDDSESDSSIDVKGSSDIFDAEDFE